MYRVLEITSPNVKRLQHLTRSFIHALQSFGAKKAILCKLCKESSPMKGVTSSTCLGSFYVRSLRNKSRRMFKAMRIPSGYRRNIW